MNAIHKAINSKDWEILLENVTQSLEKQGTSHKYIVYKSDKILLETPKNFDLSTQKLSLQEITEISKIKLNEIEQNYLRGKIDQDQEHEFSRLATNISHYNTLLIQARQAKRDQPIKQIGRTIALVFSILTSVVLVGIPFLILLRKMDQQFKNEMQNLQKNLDELQIQVNHFQLEMKKHDILISKFDCSPKLATQLLRLGDPILKKLESLELDQVNSKEIESEITSYIKEMKSFQETFNDWPIEKIQQFRVVRNAISNMKTLLPENYIHVLTSIIQLTMHDQLRKHSNQSLDENPILHQFEIDILRNTSFYRKDNYLEIEDGEAVPFLKSETKVLEAAKAIDKCTESKAEDKRWTYILQLAATQTSLNAAFMFPRTILADEGSKITWIENNIEYAIKPEFPKGLPPIHLEILRHSQTHQIEKIQVRVIGQLYLMKGIIGGDNIDWTQADKTPRLITSEALEADMSYSITLDEKDYPIISNMHCEYYKTETEIEGLVTA